MFCNMIHSTENLWLIYECISSTWDAVNEESCKVRIMFLLLFLIKLMNYSEKNNTLWIVPSINLSLKSMESYQHYRRKSMTYEFLRQTGTINISVRFYVCNGVQTLIFITDFRDKFSRGWLFSNKATYTCWNTMAFSYSRLYGFDKCLLNSWHFLVSIKTEILNHHHCVRPFFSTFK